MLSYNDKRSFFVTILRKYLNYGQGRFFLPSGFSPPRSRINTIIIAFTINLSFVRLSLDKWQTLIGLTPNANPLLAVLVRLIIER